MNRIVLYISLIVLNFACSLKYDVSPKNPSWGYLTAKMNGEEWNQTYRKGYQVVQGIIAAPGSVAPCKDEFYYLNTELYTDQGFIRQSLTLMKVPIAKGKYKVQPSVLGYCSDNDSVYGIFYTMIDDGCVSGDVYKILDSADNFLQIDDYNAKSKEIKGAFQLTFVLEREGADHTLPDTLRFTSGKFHTKIMDLRRR